MNDLHDPKSIKFGKSWAHTRLIKFNRDSETENQFSHLSKRFARLTKTIF